MKITFCNLSNGSFGWLSMALRLVSECTSKNISKWIASVTGDSIGTLTHKWPICVQCICLEYMICVTSPSVTKKPSHVWLASKYLTSHLSLCKSRYIMWQMHCVFFVNVMNKNKNHGLCASSIEAETKWPPFTRRHFEMHVLEWTCINFD